MKEERRISKHTGVGMGAGAATATAKRPARHVNNDVAVLMVGFGGVN